MAFNNTILKVVASLVTIQIRKVILIYSFKLKKKKKKGVCIASYP